MVHCLLFFVFFPFLFLFLKMGYVPKTKGYESKIGISIKKPATSGEIAFARARDWRAIAF
jgi:hypothetical protein